jgi:hypothetical protein
MPVLAIPYLVPFANAAGIVIGSVASAVGLIALSDKVQDYMEENPENSMKILAMIMPEQGIAALFNKEAGDEGEGEGEEVEEEVEVKDTRTKKEIVLDAVRKAKRGKGNYASPDAEGPAVSGRGSVIRGLEDAGKVDKGLKDKPYKKSKFNWKRFTRNKADGGIIGLKHGGQLVKRGSGRPGYGGPHETEKAGREYKEAVSRGEGEQHMQQALQQFAQLPTSSSVTTPSKKDPNQIIEQNLATGKMMTNADLLAKNRFTDLVKAKGYYSDKATDEEKELYDAYRAATGLDTHMKNALVSSDFTTQQKAVDGETMFDVAVGHNTLKDLDKDWTSRSTTVQDTAGNVTTNRLTPTGMWENDVYLGGRAPQSLAVDPYADGGRIGFEVGGLSSQAQSIYDSWIAAGHTEEDVLAYLTSQGLYGDQEATGIETIVNTAPAVGGGDGDFKGGGKWGNLDLSKTKTFNKGVWEVGGPANQYGSFVDKDITGYYDPKQGNWKTFEGKNIEHGGYFTGEPKEGDIEGTPIDWGNIPTGLWGLGIKGIKGIQNAWNEKQAESIWEAAAKRQAKSIELHKAEQAQKAADAAAGAFTNTVQLDPGGGGGPGSPGSWHGQTAAKERQGQQVAGPGFGQGAYFEDGGLATMFQRRR